MKGEHLTEDGEFWSDKFREWCRPGFFAMKFTDQKAWRPLLLYAESIKDSDPDLYADMREAIRIARAHADEDAEVAP
jgi:hypothetical protein